jgi:hypothetical protein
LCLQVKVQSLSFSCNELFLASLGGPDDNNLVRILSLGVLIGRATAGCPVWSDSALNRTQRSAHESLSNAPRLAPRRLAPRAGAHSHLLWATVRVVGLNDGWCNQVIWDIETGKAVCGNPASSDSANVVTFVNNSDFTLITAGNYNLRVWDFDRPNRKVRPHDVSVGQLRRVFNCVQVDPNDEYCYCGTTTGDILQISIERKIFKNVGPKARFSLGVQTLAFTPGAAKLCLWMCLASPRLASPLRADADACERLSALCTVLS